MCKINKHSLNFSGLQETVTEAENQMDKESTLHLTHLPGSRATDTAK